MPTDICPDATTMTHSGRFQPGHDARRNLSSGRARTGASIAAVIRRTLGHDVQRVCEQVKTLAAGGDPDAVLAAAVLLAAVARPARDSLLERAAAAPLTAGGSD